MKRIHLRRRCRVELSLLLGSVLGLFPNAWAQSAINHSIAGESTAAGASAANSAAADADYVIGPGDVLAINVWRNPELSRTMPVRPDGRIAMPLIGEMSANGLTALQLRDRIREDLRPYVSHPEVNVVIQEIRSRSFNVVGKVGKPGSFDLNKPTKVLDALALAGGFQDFAKVTKIYVLRPPGNNARSQVLHFNYKQVIKGKQTEQNVQLQPGDTVVVP